MNLRKRLLSGLCILLLLVITPLTGIAQTQEEWNLSCKYKTNKSAAVYSSPGTASGEGDANCYITTLPANTYVKKKHWSAPWRQVQWMSGGSVQSGYLLGNNISYCVSDVINEDTGPIIVHELDPKHDEIVQSNPVVAIAPSVMETRPEDFQNVTYTTPFSIIDQAIQKASTEQEKWELSCPKKTTSSTTVYKTNADVDEVLMTIPSGTYFKITNSGAGWQVIEFMIEGTKYMGKIGSGNIADTMTQVPGANGLTDAVHELDPRYNAIVSGEWQAEDATAASTTVQLQEIGTVTSKVQSEGQTIEVKTSDLVFSEDVPEDKRVAVVYAPRTGKASLRAKASSNASVIKQCKAGTIVAVLKTGNTFTQINYNGTVGYILTSCLQFHSPDAEAEGGALLSYNGKTNGSTTVNVRNQPSKDSAKVATWNTGTAVVNLSHKDGWYEIEAKGIHGYVMDQYITVK